MKVRFLKSWHYYAKGCETEIVNKAMLTEFLKMGLIEVIKPDVEVETATLEPTENAALPLKRKRGRPRKVQA